jgi:hypothetical protein
MPVICLERPVPGRALGRVRDWDGSAAVLRPSPLCLVSGLNRIFSGLRNGREHQSADPPRSPGGCHPRRAPPGACQRRLRGARCRAGGDDGFVALSRFQSAGTWSETQFRASRAHATRRSATGRFAALPDHRRHDFIAHADHRSLATWTTAHRRLRWRTNL